MRKPLRLITVFVFCCAAALLIPSTSKCDTLILTPSADVRIVAGSNADNNYEGGNLGAAQGCPSWCESHVETLLRFDLSAFASMTPTAAVLRVFVYHRGGWNNTGTVFAHFVSDDSWDETTVTWNTAPGPDWTEPQGNAIDSAPPAPSDSVWMEFDLTSAVVSESAGDGELSVRLVPEGVYQRIAGFYSSEHPNSVYWPQLELTVADESLGVWTGYLSTDWSDSQNWGQTTIPNS